MKQITFSENSVIGVGNTNVIYLTEDGLNKELRKIIKDFKRLTNYTDKINYWYTNNLGWLTANNDGVYVNKKRNLDFPQEFIDIWLQIANYSLMIVFNEDNIISIIPDKEKDKIEFYKLIIMVIEGDLQKFSDNTFLNRKNNFDKAYNELISANVSSVERITAIEQELSKIKDVISIHPYKDYKVFEGYIEYNLLEHIISNLFLEYGLGIDRLTDLSLLYDARRFSNYLSDLLESLLKTTNNSFIPNKINKKELISDNLKSLRAIWNNKDVQTMLKVYDHTKNIIKNKKDLRNLCFMLHKHNWIILPVSRGHGELARIFCSLYNLKFNPSNDGSKFNVNLPNNFSPENYKIFSIGKNDKPKISEE